MSLMTLRMAAFSAWVSLGAQVDSCAAAAICPLRTAVNMATSTVRWGAMGIGHSGRMGWARRLVGGLPGLGFRYSLRA